MKFRAKMCTCVNLRVVEVKKVALSLAFQCSIKQRVVKFATKWFSSCIYTYIHLLLSLYISLYFSFALSYHSHSCVWLSLHHCDLRCMARCVVCVVCVCVFMSRYDVSVPAALLHSHTDDGDAQLKSWVLLLLLLLFRAFVSCAFLFVRSRSSECCIAISWRGARYFLSA